MNKVITHKPFLRRCCSNPSLVKKASLSEISCLVEILHNLRSIPLTGEEKKLLCKHIEQIRSIGSCTRERKARDQLTQYGGAFLPFIIPAAIALAESLLR